MLPSRRKALQTGFQTAWTAVLDLYCRWTVFKYR